MGKQVSKQLPSMASISLSASSLRPCLSSALTAFNGEQWCRNVSQIKLFLPKFPFFGHGVSNPNTKVKIFLCNIFENQNLQSRHLPVSLQPSSSNAWHRWFPYLVTKGMNDEANHQLGFRHQEKSGINLPSDMWDKKLRKVWNRDCVGRTSLPVMYFWKHLPNICTLIDNALIITMAGTSSTRHIQ